MSVVQERRSSLRLLCLQAALAVVALTGVDAFAQPVDEPEARPLAGVLKRIKETRVVRIGVRDAAVPFSFRSTSGQPQGYSIELCQGLVEDIGAAIGARQLAIEYVRVTPADRIEQVVAGRVDLECGSTTNTAERRQRVSFSPLIFVAGTRLLVLRGSPVRSARDLNGRTVAVVRGTSNETVMRKFTTGRKIDLRVVEDYGTAISEVSAGQVAALAADDVLLAGLAAQEDRRKRFAIVGDLLSYERYGIAFARDDAALANVVNAGFGRLASSGELRSIYTKWFLRTLPSGLRLAWPMSAELERSFELLGMPPE